MQMTLNLSSNSQQFKQENDINLESQSPQKQSQGKTGPKSIEWAAGLFEGEGSIPFHKIRKNPYYSIKLGMTDLDVVQDFCKVMGYGRVLGPYQPKDKKHKSYFQWVTSKRSEVIRIIGELWPYLGTRRRAQAQAALDFIYSK